MPPNMQGLTEEQLAELKLVDEWAERCVPSGGYVTRKDVMGRRNGRGMQTLGMVHYVMCIYIYMCERDV